MKKLTKQFETFITEMEGWRGKWASDDNRDCMPWDKEGLDGVPQNSQYESAIKAARKAVSDQTQDETELTNQFETFVSEMTAWRTKWVEDYPVDKDPLTNAISEADKTVVEAKNDLSLG